MSLSTPILALFFLMAPPFWEQRPPEKWTFDEIQQLRTSSPWAQSAGDIAPVTVFFATAAPIEQSEEELRLRMKKNPHPLPEPDPDYTDYLRDHRAEAFVLGIAYPPMNTFGKPGEDKQMEQQTAMVIGHKEYRILGYFPPTPSDRVLRLVFPRAAKPTDKEVLFRLYLPGIPFPERDAAFPVRDLVYQGKLAM